MSTAARERIVLGSVVAILIGVVVLLVTRRATDGTTNPGNGIAAAVVPDSSQSFTIKGIVTEPISPGVKASLDLRLTNPNGVPISVTDLHVIVQNVSAPNADGAHPCTVGDFMVDQISSSRKITLASHSNSTLGNVGLPRANWPQVGMLNRPVGQDGCKGASLTLAFTGSGTLEN